LIWANAPPQRRRKSSSTNDNVIRRYRDGDDGGLIEFQQTTILPINSLTRPAAAPCISLY
jgi:hypothetical protein